VVTADQNPAAKKIDAVRLPVKQLSLFDTAETARTGEL